MSFIREIKKCFDVCNLIKVYLKYTSKACRLPLIMCKHKSIKLVCMERDIEKAVEIINNYYNLKIDEILVYSYNQDFYMTYYSKYKVSRFEPSKKYKGNNYVIYMDSSYDFCDWIEAVLKFDNAILERYYFFHNRLKMDAFFHFERKPDKQFIKDNYLNIMKTYRLLSDEKSKKSYKELINQIVSGNSYSKKVDFYKYFVSADHFLDKYYHPKVFIEKGDYVFDVGISAYPHTTFEFAKIVDQGKIFAFEPNPNNCKHLVKEYEAFRENSNIKLIEKGLFNKRINMLLSDNGPASSIYTTNEKVVDAEFITLDEFIKENNIEKVDFIKMDIEGAEPEALEGCIETIRKFKPKLAISIYHKPEHSFSILLQINEILRNGVKDEQGKYEFYIENQSPLMVETVLYAKYVAY